MHPLLRNLAETGNAGAGHAGFDGQQADVAVGGAAIVEQLCGAHGGAACARGQDSRAIVAEKQGVDEFGFAAGEFPHKGDGDFVFFQGLQGLIQFQFKLGILHIMINQPATVARQLAVDILSPLEVGIHLI